MYSIFSYLQNFSKLLSISFGGIKKKMYLCVAIPSNIIYNEKAFFMDVCRHLNFLRHSLVHIVSR